METRNPREPGAGEAWQLTCISHRIGARMRKARLVDRFYEPEIIRIMETKTTLRILHLEDDANDIELVQVALNRAGLAAEVNVARGRDEYLAALEAGQFDVILSDNKVLGFEGSMALQLAREKQPGVPFVFVSG